MKNKKDTQKHFDLDYCLKSIKSIKTEKNNLIDVLRNGRQKGSKTYVRDIDTINQNGFISKMWSWKLGEINLWTGYMGEGKSQFLIFLCLLKAINEGWKFAFFSPENDPPTDFFDDLIHTLLGKTTDKSNKDFNVSEKEYTDAMDKIKDHFFFVYPEDVEGYPDYSIKNIEQIFEYLIFSENVKSVIVDPYIKIKHDINPGEQEHLYASRFMMERVHFARKHNVSYHLVMHQTTPRKDKDTGNYPTPDPYNIKGGGTFADSTDNVLTVWRPNKSTDQNDSTVVFRSAKIKKHKLTGYPNEITIDFDRKKNRYISKDGYDFIDGSIDNRLKKLENLNQNSDIYRTDKFKLDGISDFETIKSPF
jgi:twinkle protein